MRNLVILLGILTIAGCTTIEQKSEDYQAAAECYGRPDKVVYCYRRENDTRTGFEARCCGEGCEVPTCP